uniref:Coatomer subunit beta n=1 Tax=Phallusia mammillata TaxID=59560 RepID=A0A6F9D9N4_9ASCI|nr:coatomer subunit beta-like [Phallusia mammillata]
MTSAESICYTLIYSPSVTDSEPVNEAKLKNDIEHGDIRIKTEALKKVILMTLNGEKLQGLLMTIIKYLLPSDDHTVKKLLLIFWEIWPKTDQQGKLRPEMILVCDAYRKDLQHPNEFIRGSTLRFLCKLRQPELIEPLMPAIRTCLEHRHSYVRRNAVLAIYTIYRKFDQLIPDAPELIHDFLEGEKDASCKRNAFMMLIHADQERALDYLSTCIDQVNTFNDILQLVIVELVYKVCNANPNERSRFIRCIYNLLQSTSQAVRYEAAGTLVTLSNAPTAIRAAAQCYIELIVKEADNNVKLIVLDRLIDLKDHPLHEKVLQEMVMDILRALASPDLEVRRKTLDLALDLVTSRNVEDFVKFMEKEITKSANIQGHDNTDKYRQMLVKRMHLCAVKFPDTAAMIIPVLMEFLGDSEELAACDVLLFVREAVHRYDAHKGLILDKLLEVFSTIRAAKIMRGVLWILGEYCDGTSRILKFVTEVRKSVGDLPIVEHELKLAAGEADENQDSEEKTAQSAAARRVTEMGTYVTQSAFSVGSKSSGGKGGDNTKRPPLRQFFMDGDFSLAGSLSTALTKQALRFMTNCNDPRKQNSFAAQCMLILSSVLHLGKSSLPKKPISDDEVDRLASCLKVLSERQQVMSDIFTSKCRSSLSTLLEIRAAEEIIQRKAAEKNKSALSAVQPDDPINFVQLLAKVEAGSLEDQFELSLNAAVGTLSQKKEAKDPGASKLNKVTQLTGFSDPVYAEAYVHINQYDIVLDVLVVNQTADTLQNCTIELATLGDLKLVEKPSPLTLAPHDFANIKASVKVASTENGIIFGNIVYDITGAGSDRNCVVLNDIHIDIMDYIQPATCTDAEFRQMWAEFEWENKVTVNTNITDLSEFLQHILSCTNMKCLTPEKALGGDSGFLAANLFAKSIFGESGLANVSIEKPAGKGPNAPVAGHIRIRAKSQGMALSLGDKLNQSQKKKK